MTATDDLLADRYGRGPKASVAKNRVLMFVFAGLVLLAFVAWALITASSAGNSVAVVSSVSKPIGKTAFEISGTVSRPAGGVVRCALQVQALDFSVVGYREIDLAASVTSFSAKVFSIAPGVSASVTGCRLL